MPETELRPEFYVKFGPYFHWDQEDEGCVRFISTPEGILVRFFVGEVETSRQWCRFDDASWHAPTPDCVLYE